MAKLRLAKPESIFTDFALMYFQDDKKNHQNVQEQEENRLKDEAAKKLAEEPLTAT